MAASGAEASFSNNFIASLSKSLQVFCQQYADFDSGVEIIGYVNVSIDRHMKTDFVLNETVQRKITEPRSIYSVSNSYLAKKIQGCHIPIENCLEAGLSLSGHQGKTGLICKRPLSERQDSTGKNDRREKKQRNYHDDEDFSDFETLLDVKTEAEEDYFPPHTKRKKGSDNSDSEFQNFVDEENSNSNDDDDEEDFNQQTEQDGEQFAMKTERSNEENFPNESLLTASSDIDSNFISKSQSFLNFATLSTADVNDSAQKCTSVVKTSPEIFTPKLSSQMNSHKISEKKKRSIISIEKKYDIIMKYENDGLKVSALCKALNIKNSTVRTILKHKDKIKKFVEDGKYSHSTQYSQARTRMKGPVYADLDIEMIKWYQQNKPESTFYSTSRLKEEAQKICARLGNPEQELSNGWIARFMGRYGISRKSEAAGESSLYMTMAEKWSSNKNIVTCAPKTSLDTSNHSPKKAHIETAGVSKVPVSLLPETSKVSLDETPKYVHEFHNKIPELSSVSLRQENADTSLNDTPDKGSLMKKNEEVEEVAKQGLT